MMSGELLGHLLMMNNDNAEYRKGSLPLTYTFMFYDQHEPRKYVWMAHYGSEQNTKVNLNDKGWRLHRG